MARRPTSPRSPPVGGRRLGPPGHRDHPQLAIDLSPPILKNEGLAETVKWIQGQMLKLHNLEVALEYDPGITVPEHDLRVLLYQSIRELLFNVAKHAQTQRALVRLSENPSGQLTIHVIDEGRGFDVEACARAREQTGGFGLFSVQKRSSSSAGRCASTPLSARARTLPPAFPLRARAGSDGSNGDAADAR